jgi:CTP:molybdopterin cytidylyltransferase MocA
MTYVVLAAGASRRMGFPKVFAPLPSEGRTPLERIAAVLEGREGIAVVPSAHREEAARMAPRLRIVVNDAVEKGMVHSLRCALAILGGDVPFGVLLADKPFLTRTSLDIVEDALAGYDVAYPRSSSGVPGHPVVFAASARDFAARLPDGDTLSLLRDEPQLRRNVVRLDDPGAFRDLDEPSQWR